MLTFVLGACGGKNASGQTALQGNANAPTRATGENTQQEEIFECQEEMYQHGLADGVFQIDDIIYDLYADRTLGEAIALFEEKGRYDIKVYIGNSSDSEPYNPDETVVNRIQAHVYRDGKDLLCFVAISTREEALPAADCEIAYFYILEDGCPYAWYGGGLSATGDGITYHNVQTELLEGFDEKMNWKTGYAGDHEYEQLLLSDVAMYRIYLEGKPLDVHGEFWYPLFCYEITIDSNKGPCKTICLEQSKLRGQ